MEEIKYKTYNVNCAARIQLMSDLHLEMTAEDLNLLPKTADILCLCGDIGVPGTPKYLQFLTKLAKQYMLVLVITGNHEYYGSTLCDTLVAARKDCSQAGVVFLENDLILINCRGSSMYIWGATFWTNVMDCDVNEVSVIASAIGDYKYIKNNNAISGNLVTVSDITQEHFKSYHALRSTIEYVANLSHYIPLVVMTHHLPSFQCIHEEYTNYPYNTVFASRHDELLEYPIILWMHGHTHKFVDKIICQTRVVCNPVGYKHEVSQYKKYFSVGLPDLL